MPKTKEELNSYMRLWYQKNKDKIKLKRDANKDEIKKYQKEYYHKNHKKRKEISRLYRKKNKSHLAVKNIEFYERFPEKRQAKNELVAARIKAPIGYARHHWSYNLQHWRDILGIKKNQHHSFHHFIDYDEKTKMYRTKDGILLDTKEKHWAYFNELRAQGLIYG